MADFDAAVDTTAIDTTVDTTTDTDIAPEIETTDPSADVSAADAGEAEVEEGQEPTAKDDARTLPRAIKESLAGLKETNPQAARALNDAYFRNEQFKKEFPEGLGAVRSMKATLDAIGGVDGVTTLQQQAQVLEHVDADIAAGNPEVLDDMIKDSPDGFKKLVPHVIDRLQALDPKSYGDALRPHFVSTLEQAGFLDVLQSISGALQEGDGATIQKIVGNLARWFGGLQDQTRNTRQPQADPERTKFEAERTEFQKTKENEFISGIQGQANKHMDESITKLIAPYLKSKPLSAEGKTDLQAAILTEALKAMGSDKTYLSNVAALRSAKGRDAGKIVRFVTAKFDQVVNTAVKSVWSRRYGATSSGTAATTSTTGKGKQPVPTASKVGGNATPVMLPRKPDVSEIDFSKDPRQLLFMTGKGVMKSGPYKGRMVAWRKS